MEEKSAFESFELDINQEIKGHLREISKWAYFLSIIGFIGIGFMIIVGLFNASLNSGSPLSWDGTETPYRFSYTFGIALFYIIIAITYFFPVLYLFKFSKKMKKALKFNENDAFVVAFKNLKSHYKFMGIFTIVIISLYAIFIFSVAMGTGAGLF